VVGGVLGRWREGEAVATSQLVSQEFDTFVFYRPRWRNDPSFALLISRPREWVGQVPGNCLIIDFTEDSSGGQATKA
jgi:hypothetical protein